MKSVSQSLEEWLETNPSLSGDQSVGLVGDYHHGHGQMAHISKLAGDMLIPSMGDYDGLFGDSAAGSISAARAAEFFDQIRSGGLPSVIVKNGMPVILPSQLPVPVATLVAAIQQAETRGTGTSRVLVAGPTATFGAPTAGQTSIAPFIYVNIALPVLNALLGGYYTVTVSGQLDQGGAFNFVTTIEHTDPSKPLAAIIVPTNAVSMQATAQLLLPGATPNELVVTVSGLPAGAVATVILPGPDFAQLNAFKANLGSQAVPQRLAVR